LAAFINQNQRIIYKSNKIINCLFTYHNSIMGGVCSGNNKGNKKTNNSIPNSSNCQSLLSPGKNSLKTDPKTNKTTENEKNEKTMANNMIPSNMNPMILNEQPAVIQKPEKIIPQIYINPISNKNSLIINKGQNVYPIDKEKMQNKEKSASLANSNKNSKIINQISNQDNDYNIINPSLNVSTNANNKKNESEKKNSSSQVIIQNLLNPVEAQLEIPLKPDKSNDILAIFNSLEKPKSNSSLLNFRNADESTSMKKNEFFQIETQELNFEDVKDLHAAYSQSNAKLNNMITSQKNEEIIQNDEDKKDGSFSIHSSVNFEIEVSKNLFNPEENKEINEQILKESEIYTSVVQKYSFDNNQNTNNGNPALDEFFEGELNPKVSEIFINTEQTSKLKKDAISSSILPRKLDFFGCDTEKKKENLGSAMFFSKQNLNPQPQEIKRHSNYEIFKDNTEKALKSELVFESPTKLPKEYPQFQKSSYLRSDKKAQNNGKTPEKPSNFAILPQISKYEEKNHEENNQKISKIQQMNEVFTTNMCLTSYIEPKKLEISSISWKEENVSLKYDQKPFESSDERSNLINGSLSIDNHIISKKRNSTLTISSNIFNISFTKKKGKEQIIIEEKKINQNLPKDFHTMLDGEGEFNEMEEFSDFSEEKSHFSKNVGLMNRTFFRPEKKNEQNASNSIGVKSFEKSLEKTFEKVIEKNLDKPLEKKMENKKNDKNLLEQEDQYGLNNIFREEEEEKNEFKISFNGNEDFPMFENINKEKNKDTEKMINLNLQKNSVKGKNTLEIDGVFISQKN